MASDSFVGELLTPSPYKQALTDWAFDVGDPQFWIDRRVACLLGGYPPSEANYVSLQEYVLAVELEHEMLRAQVQAYRADLHREVDAHCVTIRTLNNIYAAALAGEKA